MLFKGYKIRVRCIDWEQVDLLGEFWNLFSSSVGYKNIVGLGMNWTSDNLYFDYAIGVINDEQTFENLKFIDFEKYGFNVEYIEIKLPDLNEWEIFKGKESNIKEIYENYIDSCNKFYDYELEYIDGNGNIEIKIHYID